MVAKGGAAGERPLDIARGAGLLVRAAFRLSQRRLQVGARGSPPHSFFFVIYMRISLTGCGRGYRPHETIDNGLIRRSRLVCSTRFATLAAGSELGLWMICAPRLQACRTATHMASAPSATPQGDTQKARAAWPRRTITPVECPWRRSTTNGAPPNRTGAVQAGAVQAMLAGLLRSQVNVRLRGDRENSPIRDTPKRCGRSRPSRPRFEARDISR